MMVTVSPLGIILMPLGLFLFLRSRRQLFWGTVLLIPFFYTYVLDLEFTNIQPYQFFGALLILRHAIDLSVGAGPRLFGISKPTAALIAFLFLVYLSLFMSVVLEGSIYVIPTETPYQDFENVEPLRFGMSNVTQSIYPTFMVLLFVCMVREIRDLRIVQRIVQLNIVTAVVVIASGIFFQIAMIFGLRESIEALYRFVTGFTDVSRIYYGATYNMMGPLPRMFTLSGEPGYTSAYLLTLFGVVVALHYNVVRQGWKLRHNRLAEALLLAGLLLAGSTTGYLGLFVMVVVLFAVPRLFRLGAKGHRFKSALLMNVLLALVLGGLVLVTPILMETSFLDYVYTTHYQKLFEEAGSGFVRLATVASGVEVFSKSPLLGVGYGSHRTGSLLTSLLSNVGVLGTSAFFLFNGLVFARGVKVCRRSGNRELVSITFALLVSFATLFPTMLIGMTMVAIVQGWYWLLMAMMGACYRIHLQAARVPSPRPVVSEERAAPAPSMAV